MAKVKVLLVLLALSFSVQAQQNLQGYFTSDSVKIGAHLPYVLVYKHAPDQEVVFPDSAHNFQPFEFVEKRFFPTRTDSTGSTDSTIYILRTFRLDKLQKLALPVLLLRGKDTIRLYPRPDSVILHELVKNVQEPLELKENTKLAPVPERFNYPYLLGGIAATLILLSLIWFLFREGIKRRYKLYTTRKDYRTFLSRYKTQRTRFSRSASLASLENAVTLWKNYLTKLEQVPINSFTTKEIVVFYNDNESVNAALKTCDRAIYGSVLNEQLDETQNALEQLQQFATGRYQHKRELIQHARTV